MRTKFSFISSLHLAILAIYDVRKRSQFKIKGATLTLDLDLDV